MDQYRINRARLFENSAYKDATHKYSKSRDIKRDSYESEQSS